MVYAVGARTQGDDYQARVFWLNACRLLMPNSNVVRVVYEDDSTRFFDDVGVFYGRDVAIERGEYSKADHYQVKFHVDHSGRFTYESFTDPKFIGVKEKSLLQRVQQFLEEKDYLCRLYVVAPWGIKDNDPLNKLVSNAGGEIRLRQLLSDQVPMRKVRDHWAKHLNLANPDALVRCLKPLRMEINYLTLEGLNRKLDFALFAAGLVPIDETKHSNPYDDLIRKLQQAGKTSFTKDEMIGICSKEGLLAHKQTNGSRIGIRSFMRWAEHIEEETSELLSLEQLFDAREILDDRSWNDDIPKRLLEFVNRLKQHSSYELRLDAHSSLAFAAGHCLNPKRGIEIGTVQRTLGREVVWKPDLNTVSVAPELVWQIEEIPVNQGASDTAIVLNITHDATKDVIAFANKAPQIARLLKLSILPTISSTAVKDANHCLQLAQAVSALVKQRIKRDQGLVLHIFAAAPNAFMFLLGQLSQGFGPTLLYEYDFDSSALGAYKPSIRFPLGTKDEKHGIT